MHTYRKAKDGWQVVYDLPAEKRTPVGPVFVLECGAAAFACFLNGGRFCPDEIAPIFGLQQDTEEDDSIHPDRPKSFDDDYPLEGTQRHG